MSIFGPDALPVVHQWPLPRLEPATSRVRVAAHNHYTLTCEVLCNFVNLTGLKCLWLTWHHSNALSICTFIWMALLMCVRHIKIFTKYSLTLVFMVNSNGSCENVVILWRSNSQEYHVIISFRVCEVNFGTVGHEERDVAKSGLDFAVTNHKFGIQTTSRRIDDSRFKNWLVNLVHVVQH